MNKSKVDVKITSWNGKYNLVKLESEKIEVLDSYCIFTKKNRNFQLIERLNFFLLVPRFTV